MSKNYPYIQDRKTISGICPVCKENKKILQLEWRVDWFQGNCEFENICASCLNKRNQRERSKQEAYEKRMEPVWEKQRQKRDTQEGVVKRMVWDLGLEIQEYDNGQWAIGGLIDWWTTTGTAIERKSRKQHHFSFKRPEEIKKVLETLAPKQ